ncbi:MAG: hypothetical protein OES24_17915 [Acidimicrobiia bacterium]|nr:hypothetical protein [Acidimicrobiia bacterium]
MYLQRPDEPSGGSRFLLALSLSTVTALAVAAPLAFKAITVDSDLGGQDAEVSDVTEMSTTTTAPPSGPQIGPKVRSPLAKLPIRPGLPSDFQEETTTATRAATAPAATVPTTVATTALTPTTTATTTSSSTSETTVTSTSSTSALSTSSTPPSSSTSIALDAGPSVP